MSDRFVCSLLQLEPRSIPGEDALAAVRELVRPIGLTSEILQDNRTGKPVILRVGAVMVGIAPQSVPIDPASLKPATALSIAWPQAGDVAAAHRAHIIIGCLDLPEDHEQARHMAVVTTLVAAAVQEACAATAAYWMTGQVLLAPRSLDAAAKGVLNRGLPVEDWVNLHWLAEPGEGSSRRFGAVSIGASSLIGMEIEWLPSALLPVEVAQKIYSTLTYLLVHGAVIKDGDTLGQSETDVFRVRMLDRGLHHPGRVMQLREERSTSDPEVRKPLSPTRTDDGPTPTFGKRGRS